MSDWGGAGFEIGDLVVTVDWKGVQDTCVWEIVGCRMFHGHPMWSLRRGNTYTPQYSEAVFGRVRHVAPAIVLLGRLARRA